MAGRDFRNWIRNMQFIQDGSVACTLDVEYYDSNLNGCGDEQLTVEGSPVTLASIPDRAYYATIYVGPADTAGAQIRYRLNAAPTSAEGIIVANGGYLNWMPGEG